MHSYIDIEGLSIESDKYFLIIEADGGCITRTYQHKKLTIEPIWMDLWSYMHVLGLTKDEDANPLLN